MKFFISLLTTLMTSCAAAQTVRPHTTAEFAKTAVKITNKAQTSGGSGVIFESNMFNSYVLTNRHVCEILKTGGVVSTDKETYNVVAFKTSKVHDLCVVKVGDNMHVNTVVASDEPEIYSRAHISGHPHLLPHVVTHGDFSGKLVIDIVVEVRPCTAEEVAKHPLECLFFGHPVTDTLEAQLVSATILPGSSGSAVFNDKGEICGLAFAGDSRELSYALIVPQPFLVNFVEYEINSLPWQYPNALADDKNSNVAPHRNRVFFPPIEAAMVFDCLGSSSCTIIER